MSFWGFRPYVTVAARRERAAREIKKLRKERRVVTPIVVEGRTIARNFWGKAWCDNLASYSDFANRLPRGRSYVNNGLVIDLKIARGKVDALVSGSETYKVKIDIAVAAPDRWKAICADCAGSVGSLVELLQGKLSKNVMERVCREADGLFPAPIEIKMTCSCPDWAGMCKHAAATLYGVGARLDSEPDLLFTLRGVNREDMVSTVGADLPLTATPVAGEHVLDDSDLAALFGIDIAKPAKVERGLETSSGAERVSAQAKSEPKSNAKPEESASLGKRKTKAKTKTKRQIAQSSVALHPDRKLSRPTPPAAMNADRRSGKTNFVVLDKAAVKRVAAKLKPREGAQSGGPSKPPSPALAPPRRTQAAERTDARARKIDA